MIFYYVLWFSMFFYYVLMISSVCVCVCACAHRNFQTHHPHLTSPTPTPTPHERPSTQKLPNPPPGSTWMKDASGEYTVVEIKTDKKDERQADFPEAQKAEEMPEFV